jgi:hypothetical protein
LGTLVAAVVVAGFHDCDSDGEIGEALMMM